MLGETRELDNDQLELIHHTKNYLPEFLPRIHSSEEKALRRHICEIAHRAYEHQLIPSTEGVISHRLAADDFLITPMGLDRRLLRPSDIVLISNSRREQGKLPSRSVLLHDRIYRDHSDIMAIISGQPPNASAFAVTDKEFDTHSIPESYILLRDIQRISFGPQYTDERLVSRQLGKDTPVVLLENDSILVIGDNLLQAYDRLEVAEFSARSLIYADQIGGMTSMEPSVIEELKRHFLE